jgi:hypothetical protein
MAQRIGRIFIPIKDESTLYGTSKLFSHCIVFRVLCLSFNHVIIMKDFDNVFAYYVSQNPKKSNVKKINFVKFCMT